ncbi:shikimate dehydrogenase [Listeria sp. PSOL-1]|uniref:shikimate dehydrogenase n=1 Tax=Listeria sp. PSOL-1 TaxID=1844999 RepID=UPI0018D8E1E2|nr:shikimate dehydrogenase [Listeria sp. PSOL-1]
MKKYAVIGNPIHHSLSPIIHNRLIQELSLDAHYDAIQIDPERFDAEITRLKQSDISGFNVTVPFKERIIPYLDEIHGLAKSCYAVNTVVRENNRWHGYNTDGDGYFEALMDIYKIHPNDKILIIGAGGASKGIYLTLKKRSLARIDVTNRTIQRAKEMLISREDSALSIAEAEARLSEYSIIIQTTSIGLIETKDQLPLSLKNLSADTLVSDIIYNPFETRFLKVAREKGAKTQNGLSMFIGQGALAFKYWTGITPDRKLMKEAVLEALSK